MKKPAVASRDIVARLFPGRPSPTRKSSPGLLLCFGRWITLQIWSSRSSVVSECWVPMRLRPRAYQAYRANSSGNWRRFCSYGNGMLLV